MGTINKTIGKLQNYRWFRLLFSKVYSKLNKTVLFSFLKEVNKGSISDAWDHNKDSGKYDHLFKEYQVDFKNMIKIERKYNFGFLINPNPLDTMNIKNACNSIDCDYAIFDIKNPFLFREILAAKPDGIFIIPTFENNLLRNLFQEAAQILSMETNMRIYPSLRELNFYESKRALANFLSINNIPHPSTLVFHDFETARAYLEKAIYPIVFKTNIGASASGVEILNNKNQALKLAKQLFNKYYLRKSEIDSRAGEWGYMILQEYIQEVKEFRVIKIYDSWFSYQKWKNEDQIFLSGSGTNKWINPHEDLLNFCSDLASKFSFNTMAFDIFVNMNGDMLVNELQTWFGSYNPSQMYLEDGTPGRYRKLNGKWIFEPGLYNVNGSILLRIIHLISILQDKEQLR